MISVLSVSTLGVATKFIVGTKPSAGMLTVDSTSNRLSNALLKSSVSIESDTRPFCVGLVPQRGFFGEIRVVRDRTGEGDGVQVRAHRGVVC